MFGRPVQLFAAATIAAAASFFSVGAASAGCYSCGPSVVYEQPTVSYAAPVVYGRTYAAPVVYPAPVQYAPASCGCATQAPMYVVNQGPAFNAPVVGEAEPIPFFDGGYRRAYPYYAGGHLRWHHRHWYRGYRGYGPRFGYRYHRYGAFVPGARYAMRHPVVGPRAFYRGGMKRMHGPRFMMHGPRHPMVGRGGMHRGPQHMGGMHMGGMMPRRHMGGMKPGSVHPMPMPAPKKMP